MTLLSQQCGNYLLIYWVKAGKRLVQDEIARLVDQAASELQFLLVTLGKGTDLFTSLSAQFKFIQPMA
ncbi:hypothetical protein XaFJ1_GM000679 [Xanthomonas albilineans]|nr:hypothetical protein XaFJ1_GM000679 [Xanthomonas albilineans]